MLIFDIIVAVAPIFGYISQLNLIKEQKSLGTFSIYVCAILMISGILRIFFWFAEGYAINLLFQAIFIIIVQVIAIKLRRGSCSSSASNCRLGPRISSSLSHSGTGTPSTNTVTNHHISVRFLFGLTAVTTALTLIT